MSVVGGDAFLVKFNFMISLIIWRNLCRSIPFWAIFAGCMSNSCRLTSRTMYRMKVGLRSHTSRNVVTFPKITKFEGIDVELWLSSSFRLLEGEGHLSREAEWPLGYTSGPSPAIRRIGSLNWWQLKPSLTLMDKYPDFYHLVPILTVTGEGRVLRICEFATNCNRRRLSQSCGLQECC